MMVEKYLKLYIYTFCIYMYEWNFFKGREIYIFMGISRGNIYPIILWFAWEELSATPP